MSLDASRPGSELWRRDQGGQYYSTRWIIAAAIIIFVIVGYVFMSTAFRLFDAL